MSRPAESAQAMGPFARLSAIPGRLYRGEVSVNFVGRRKLWYTISGCILVISIAALLFRGLDYSIDFKGGSQFTLYGAPATAQAQIQSTVQGAGGGANPTIQYVQPFGGKPPFWQVQTGTLGTGTQQNVIYALAKQFHVNAAKIAVTSVSASWGSQISEKALEALIAFLIVIVLYLSIAFEWRMAAAAFVALLHDILITVGVYALAGFTVSPATVIGLLTILGYSLYDTVVVFDKVRENTAPILSTRRSNYSDAANLALNQTLVRSINTSLIALLPVAAILVVGTLLLGNGELKDLSLVLFVGMLSGTYSSICIATPVLTDLKEREPQYKQLARQVALRAAGGRSALRKAAVASATAGGATGNGGGAGTGGATATRQAPAGRLAEADDLTEPEFDGEQEAEESAQAGEPVPASRTTAGSSGARAAGTGSRPAGSRQQPTRRPASKRRPSGKKKRR
jgi:preprotein translocase subunit SecF